MLTEEQQLIRDMARQFAAEQLAPFSAQWEKSREFPKAAIQTMGELGMMGMLIPEDFGGAGAGYVAFALTIEEIAFASGSCSTIMAVNNSVVCNPIYQYGNDAQKKDFLIPLASGKQLGCFCLTEPQAGSDASRLLTKAKRTENGYVLNGVKQFITSGKNADIAIVFALTDASAGKKGISAFIVPTNSSGYGVAKIEDKMGQNASDTAQITLDNCEVPISNLLGNEGEGYKIALRNLEGGRIGIAAQCVGIARAALESSINYSREREAFGQPIAEYQSIAFELAEMATELDAARLLYLRAAKLKEENTPCLKEASMAKLFASQVAEKICSRAIHIHGGYGYLTDFPVERFYRDVKVAQIYEGTNEVQKMVISRALLQD